MFWVGENKYVKGLNTLSIRIWHCFNVTYMGRVLKDIAGSNNLSMLCISHLIYNCAYQQLISGPIKSKLNLLLWENDIRVNRVSDFRYLNTVLSVRKGKGSKSFGEGSYFIRMKCTKWSHKGEAVFDHLFVRLSLSPRISCPKQRKGFRLNLALLSTLKLVSRF